LGDQPCKNGVSSKNTSLLSVAMKSLNLYNEIKGYQEVSIMCVNARQAQVLYSIFVPNNLYELEAVEDLSGCSIKNFSTRDNFVLELKKESVKNKISWISV
jgi:hypothetical protein